MVLKELILTVSTLGGSSFLLSQLANPVEWINLMHFKKLGHSSSINFTCQKINNILLTLHNSSIFFLSFGRNLLILF